MSLDEWSMGWYPLHLRKQGASDYGILGSRAFVNCTGRLRASEGLNILEVKEIMAAISLSDRVFKLIGELEIEGDINRKLERLLESELIRRLTRYQLTNRLLKEKYSMSFDEFKKNRIVEKKNYSFEVESDFWNWEMALDGIETINRKLKVLKEPQDEHQ
jgi:hypothetical protein